MSTTPATPPTILDRCRDALAGPLTPWLDPRARLERRAAEEVQKARHVLLNWIAPDRTEETSHYYRVGDRWTRSLLVFDKPARAAAGWSGWLASLLLCDGGPKAHGSVRLSITWSGSRTTRLTSS